MPVIEYFPHSGPNRRSDITVVEHEHCDVGITAIQDRVPGSE